MSAFYIFRIKVNVPEKMQEYSGGAGPLVKEYEGEFLFKGPAEEIKGTSDYPMAVVIKFPSTEKAKGWYNDERYQALLPLRDEAMDCAITFVDAQ